MGFSANIRAGGGFLNNVDGVIVGYLFTACPPQSRQAGEWVYLVPSIRVDGSEEDVTQHLFLGAIERYEISDNGQSLTMVDGASVTIGAKTPAGRFLASLIAQGFPESRLPDLEQGEALNLEAMVGTRLRFVQEVDEASTLKIGKRKDKRTGKEYDRTNTLVAAVLALPGEDGGKAKGTKGARPLGTPTPASKRAPKTTHSSARLVTSVLMNTAHDGTNSPDGLQDAADTVLLEIVAAATNNIVARRSLSLEVTKRRLKDPQRDALRELIYGEAYLTGAAERGLITFNPQTQTISGGT